MRGIERRWLGGHGGLAIAVPLGAALLVSACSGGGAGDSARGLFANATGGTGTSTQAVLEPVAFETIAKGGQSHVLQREEHFVTDDAAWTQVWSAHLGQSTRPPAFDFTSEAIVAIFQGPGAVLGYQTEIVGVSRDPATGVVHVLARELAPGDWRPSATVLSSAFHFVRIPAAPASAPTPASGQPRLVVRYQQRLDSEAIDQGAQSLIGQGDPSYTGDLQILRTQADLASFWAIHQGPGAQPPVGINWNGESVVCVLAGFRGSFGHSVEMLGLVYDPDTATLRADFVVHPYRGGAAPPPVTETPYVILRTNRLPSGIVARAELRQALPITEVAAGEHALYHGTRDVVVVREQQAFDALVGQRLDPQTAAALPAIDWSRDQAVLLFLGEQMTGGYAISMARADLLEDGEVDQLVQTRDPIGSAPRIITSPFQVVTMPRTFGPVTTRFIDVTPRP